MPLLDAALAYALTLLLFATIVSAAVGAIYHVLSLKEKGLKTFLRHFFDTELSSTLQSELQFVTNKVDTTISDKLQQATDDLVKVVNQVAYNATDSNSTSSPSHELLNKAQTQRLVHYSSDEFITHLRASEFGKTVKSELKENSDELFERLAKRYEQFGDRFSIIFRKKAKVTATLVGIFLAYGVNVDSIHLLSSYMSNNQLRGQIIGTQNAILSHYKEQQDASKQGPNEQITALSDSVQSLRSDAFPVGWSGFPHCPLHSTDYRCITIAKKSETSSNESSIPPKENKARSVLTKIYSHFELYFTWFLGCLVTGLLSGLGAPFWYDVVKDIAHFKQKKT